MQVTNVRVSFLREKQPAQYEKAAPAVEFAAVLDDGENHQAAARQLMIDATAVVYAGIGYAVPEKIAAALASDGEAPGLSVTTKTANVAPAASEEVPEATPATKDKPKTRGRPAGSKNTAPKKETAKAKRVREEAEAAAAAAEVPDDELAVPGDDGVPGNETAENNDEVPGEPDISTGDARVGPDDDPADHDAEFTPKDLHTMFQELVPKKLSVVNAKQVLAHFKVARAGDLTSEQALEGKLMIEKMVAATAVQTDESDVP